MIAEPGPAASTRACDNSRHAPDSPSRCTRDRTIGGRESAHSDGATAMIGRLAGTLLEKNPPQILL
ncbi:MAG: hypothetical protein ACREX7_03055, partial [Casimicrobiaceae bacterium]